MVDTEGLLLNVAVHAADIQDRDGALLVLTGLRQLFPWLELIWADGGYRGGKLAGAFSALGKWRMEIVKRSDTVKGFTVLSRRWVVERTFGWLGRSRRLAKDYEGIFETAVAYIKVAMIQLMLRRLARA